MMWKFLIPIVLTLIFLPASLQAGECVNGKCQDVVKPKVVKPIKAQRKVEKSHTRRRFILFGRYRTIRVSKVRVIQ